MLGYLNKKLVLNGIVNNNFVKYDYMPLAFCQIKRNFSLNLQNNDNRSIEYIRYRKVAKDYATKMPNYIQGKFYFRKEKYRISRDYFKRA